MVMYKKDEILAHWKQSNTTIIPTSDNLNACSQNSPLPEAMMKDNHQQSFPKNIYSKISLEEIIAHSELSNTIVVPNNDNMNTCRSQNSPLPETMVKDNYHQDFPQNSSEEEDWEEDSLISPESYLKEEFDDDILGTNANTLVNLFIEVEKLISETSSDGFKRRATVKMSNKSLFPEVEKLMTETSSGGFERRATVKMSNKSLFPPPLKLGVERNVTEKTSNKKR